MDVLLACGTGPQAGARANLQELWPRLTGLRWLHSVFAGLEHLMFPELADSDVVMTNAKVTGVPARGQPHSWKLRHLIMMRLWHDLLTCNEL